MEEALEQERLKLEEVVKMEIKARISNAEQLKEHIGVQVWGGGERRGGGATSWPPIRVQGGGPSRVGSSGPSRLTLAPHLGSLPSPPPLQVSTVRSEVGALDVRLSDTAKGLRRDVDQVRAAGSGNGNGLTCHPPSPSLASRCT